MLSYEDLAARWGVTTNTLRVWRHRGKLPEPDLVIGRSPGWNLDTIKRMETQDDPKKSNPLADSGNP